MSNNDFASYRNSFNLFAESPSSSTSKLSDTSNSNMPEYSTIDTMFNNIESEEKEPASLDSLELPEIDTAAKKEFEKQQRKTRKTTRKPRFKPCDGCRKRKTKCTILPNQRVCSECSRRDQPCEYDSSKIFLFNNVNALSGVTKLIKTSNGISKSYKSGNTLKNPRPKSCDNCKKKRSKCVTGASQKSCNECLKKNVVCTYSQNLLEMYPITGRVKLLSDSHPNSDDRSIEKPVKDYSFLNEPSVMACSLSLLGSKSTTIIGECSVLEKKLLQMPPRESEGLTLIRNPISSLEDGDKVIRKLNGQTYFQIVDDNEDFINLKYLQCDEIEALVRPNSNYLINLYFKLVEPTLPILSKPAFYERYCRNYREIHPLLLVTVYLLALNWWELDANEYEVTLTKDTPFVKSTTIPDIAKLELIAIALMDDNLFETPKFSVLQAFLLLSNYSFHNSNNPFNTGSVWKIGSLMNTYAAEIGLNWSCHDWITIPLWERKVRKIVAWCVIFHEKLYALFEGKSSNIDLENNWVLEPLTYNDFFMDTETLTILSSNELMIKNRMFEMMVTNESQKELEISDFEHENIDLGKDRNNKYISKLIFMETVNLSFRIDQILIQIYSLKSLRFDSFDVIYEKSIPLIENLKKWFDGLPKQIKLVNPAQEKSEDLVLLGNKERGDFERFSLISNGSLNLLYYSLILLIYKRLITKYIDSLETIGPQFDESTISEVIDKFGDLKPQIKKLLKTVIYMFLFNLKPYNLESFWLLSTRRSFIFIGVIIALLVKTVKLEAARSPDDGLLKSLLLEKSELINLYKDFHWKLTIMAPDFNHARVALRYLDNLIGVVDEGKEDGGGDSEGKEGEESLEKNFHEGNVPPTLFMM